MITETEVLNRPFEIKAIAETINTNNHPVITEKVKKLLNDKKRFSVKLRYESETFWNIVIGYKDARNANFKDDHGEIFVAIVDNDLLNENLRFNDMIEFQSCDIIDLEVA